MKNTPAITHWCLHCDRHHPQHQVSGAVPASPDSEVDVLICPTCNSYDIEELLEVSDAQ
ncbi:hypothetical protein SAMN05444743_11145 [Pseudomonas sp. PDC86]|jgi:hypothetical protein|uniref:hypothetical protein n=1 Tax=unclassified Pseudomonas TaxID=196821 RepID=UPI0008993CAB|nr:MULTISPECIES: hypothetical protein [unclassified Pseudomonas]SDZ23864.1 hypothetical protein SAMN05444743_11145 [Pseudomonas sp. PDC86]